MFRTEQVCADACGYEVAVANGRQSAFQRMSPDACPRCGATLEVVA